MVLEPKVRRGGCVAVNSSGVIRDCVLAPKERAEPPLARESTRPEAVIEPPAERAWSPITYCDWALAVILLFPRVITGAGVA